MRWEEPHHPGPGLQLERHSTPLPPTLQHDLKQVVPIATSIAAARVRPVSPSEPTATSPPDDSDDLRGFYFRLLLGRTGTRIGVAAAAIAGGVAGALLASPAIGAAPASSPDC